LLPRQKLVHPEWREKTNAPHGAQGSQKKKRKLSQLKGRRTANGKTMRARVFEGGKKGKERGEESNARRSGRQQSAGCVS